MPLVKKTFMIDRKCLILVHLMRLLDISQASIQRLFDRKRVYLNGELLIDKSCVGEGVVEVVLFEASHQNSLVSPMFITKNFAIFDKPSFLLSHPKDDSDRVTLLDSVKHFLGKSGNIVHRLDFETSGLLIAAKTRDSEVRLKELFEKRLVKKWYEAIVRGVIEGVLTIDEPILQNNDYLYTKHKAIVDKSGKKATTTVIPVTTDGDTTLVRLYPKEGRLHQLRVHLNHIGHPILGDPIYGVPFETSCLYLDGKLDFDTRIKLTGAHRVLLNASGIEFQFEGIKYIFNSKINLSKSV